MYHSLNVMLVFFSQIQSNLGVTHWIVDCHFGSKAANVLVFLETYKTIFVLHGGARENILIESD